MPTLNADHLGLINTGLMKAEEALIELAKCKECGDNVDDIIAIVNEQKARLQKRKATYFPQEQ